MATPREVLDAVEAEFVLHRDMGNPPHQFLGRIRALRERFAADDLEAARDLAERLGEAVIRGPIHPEEPPAEDPTTTAASAAQPADGVGEAQGEGDMPVGSDEPSPAPAPKRRGRPPKKA